MRIKKHNFPKGFDIACNEKLSTNQIHKIFFLCFRNGVSISDHLIEKGIHKLSPYLCFGETSEKHGEKEKMCVCDEEHFTTGDEKVISVNFKDFKRFIKGKYKYSIYNVSQYDLNIVLENRPNCGATKEVLKELFPNHFV